MENETASSSKNLTRSKKAQAPFGHLMQGHGPRPDRISQYCLDLASSIKKIRQNAEENSDSENEEISESESIAAASSTKKTRQNASENSDSDSENESALHSMARADLNKSGDKFSGACISEWDKYFSFCSPIKCE